MRICIYSSELAVITGHNTYKDVSEIILKLWQKNFPEDFQQILDEKKIVVESPDEYIQRISKENKLDIKEKLNSCLNSDDVIDMNKKQKEIIKQLGSVSEKDRQMIKDCIKEKTNTNFGTKHENNGVEKYEEEYGDTVKKVDTFFKKFVYSGEYEWYVGGKIDGINKDNVLIEVKNRMNRLFYKLRDYEKVQIFSYLYILEITKARLVECFKKKDSCNINVIDVDFDQDFWDNEILSKIVSFSSMFENFMKNRTKRLELADILFSTNTT